MVDADHDSNNEGFAAIKLTITNIKTEKNVFKNQQINVNHQIIEFILLTRLKEGCIDMKRYKSKLF